MRLLLCAWIIRPTRRAGIRTESPLQFAIFASCDRIGAASIKQRRIQIIKASGGGHSQKNREAPCARGSSIRLQVERTPVSRPRGACGPWHDDEQEPSDHQLSACACEIHGGACERCGSVDTCASRNSPSELVSAFAYTKEANCVVFPMLRKAAAPG